MVTDPISDLIINIKNANFAGKESISIFHSKLKEAIAEVLVKEGYVKAVSKKKKSNKFDITLAYDANGKSKIREISRMSKPSRRMYFGADEIKPFKNGYGRVIISTSKGIVTDKEAKKQKLGGETLFKIW
jgi:small subunit ribosomal protein S8